MIIGMTYDLKDDYRKAGYPEQLIAEFDNLQTIEALEAVFEKEGHQVIRIGGIRSLVAFLAKGSRCDIVFNICEGLHGMAREAQVPALLEAYGIPCVFSDAMVLALCLHKGMTKAVVARSGVPTPDYYMIAEEKDIAAVDLPFPLFLKPVGGGTGMGISSKSIVHDRDSLEKEARYQLKTFDQPVIAETVLEGREFTTGILGTGTSARCIASMEIVVDHKSDDGIYSYKTKQDYKECTTYHLVEDAQVNEQCEKVALGAWRALGCRDGGRVDLKMDCKGRVQFLEVNPLAGLNPIDSDLPMLARFVGMDYDHLIREIFSSALDRLGMKAR